MKTLTKLELQHAIKAMEREDITEAYFYLGKCSDPDLPIISFRDEENKMEVWSYLTKEKEDKL